MLKPDDFVGISFFVATMAMMASAVFFFFERSSVKGKWKTSLTVAGLITGVAAIHYLYMRDMWVETGQSPTVFRYIDWLITVPLQIVEFYLILAAITIVPVALFWRLLIYSLVMLVFGYLGEAGFMNVTLGFVIGMAGWLLILYEIFAGAFHLLWSVSELITEFCTEEYRWPGIRGCPAIFRIRTIRRCHYPRCQRPRSLLEWCYRLLGIAKN